MSARPWGEGRLRRRLPLLGLAPSSPSSMLPFPRTGFLSCRFLLPPGRLGSPRHLILFAVRQRGCPVPGPLPHPFNFSQLTHVPCQLRETGDHDPFLLLGANLKRELAGEPLYRRALRELGLPGGARPGPQAAGRGEGCARAKGSGLPGTAEKGLSRGMTPITRGRHH